MGMDQRVLPLRLPGENLNWVGYPSPSLYPPKVAMYQRIEHVLTTAGALVLMCSACNKIVCSHHLLSPFALTANTEHPFQKIPKTFCGCFRLEFSSYELQELGHPLKGGKMGLPTAQIASAKPMSVADKGPEASHK